MSHSRPPLRVAYDSRGASDPRGIGRYVRSLRDALRRTATDGDELIETSRPRRVAVYHSPWIDGAQLRPRGPMVVTLHDLIPLKRRGEYLRTGLRFRLRYLAVRRAARVVVPTHAVAADAAELLELDPARVDVIPEAVSPALRPADPEAVAAARELYGLPERYLLWVGGLEHPDPRKRVAALVDAPRRLPLVLVGKHARWSAELRDVHLTGHVPDEDLAAIYTGAHALVLQNKIKMPQENKLPAQAIADLQRRARAGVPLRRRGLRLAHGRGAGLRHPGGGL